MPTVSNIQFTPPAGRYEQVSTSLVERMPVQSQERVNAEFERTVAVEFPTGVASKEDALVRDRDNLQRAYGEPTPEQIAKMIDEITTYLVQEADLLEGYRAERAGVR